MDTPTMRRRGFLVSVVGISLSGCSALGFSGGGKSAEEAASKLKEDVEAHEDVNRVETKLLEDGDVEVQIWYTAQEEGERINLLDVYARLVEGGYDIGDLVVQMHVSVIDAEVIVKRTWAEQFNAGEMTRDEFSAKVNEQI